MQFHFFEKGSGLFPKGRRCCAHISKSPSSLSLTPLTCHACSTQAAPKVLGGTKQNPGRAPASPIHATWTFGGRRSSSSWGPCWGGAKTGCVLRSWSLPSGGRGQHRTHGTEDSARESSVLQGGRREALMDSIAWPRPCIGGGQSQDSMPYLSGTKTHVLESAVQTPLHQP